MIEFPELIDCEAVARHVASDPRILEHIPPAKLIEAIGAEQTIDALLSRLSLEQVREMLNRRQPKPPPEEQSPS